MVEACFLFSLNPGGSLGKSLCSLKYRFCQPQDPEWVSSHITTRLSPYFMILDLLFPRIMLGISTTLRKIIPLLMGHSHGLWPLNRNFSSENNNTTIKTLPKFWVIRLKQIIPFFVVLSQGEVGPRPGSFSCTILGVFSEYLWEIHVSIRKFSCLHKIKHKIKTQLFLQR